MERKVITELIQLYRDKPCLWDMTSEEYKNNQVKTAAWKILAEKLREIEPDANIPTVKKKIDHLRSSFKREFRKVIQSKKECGISAKDVHKPGLWYYKLMTFLEKTSEESGIDENEKSVQRCNKRKSSIGIDQKKENIIIEVAHDLLKHKPNKTNSFGTYVGEQLEQLTTYQRQIAEKLISEVIFLAKTENLNFDSRVETSSKSNCFANCLSVQVSPEDVQQITQSQSSCASYQSTPSSPSDQVCRSPRSVEPRSPRNQTPSNTAQDTLTIRSSSQTVRSTESPRGTKSSEEASLVRDSKGSLLKELLSS